MTHLTLIKSAALSALLASAAAVSAHAVFFHVGSGSIDGSRCVGNDCVNGESFGFDTHPAEGKQPAHQGRGHLDRGVFPAQRLADHRQRQRQRRCQQVLDRRYRRRPHVLHHRGWRAQQRAVCRRRRAHRHRHLDPGDRSPHQDGNTPTLRLEQDGTSGFTPQTWDMAGNEAGFFIRDATSGSTLPFRIITGGAPSQSLVIDGDGEVGVGAGTNPSAALHVRRSDGTAQLLVEETSGTTSNTRIQLQLENNGSAQIALVDNNNSTDWRVQNLNDAFRVTKAGTGVAELEMDNAGNVTIQGTLTELSDKNAKMAIEPIDTDAVLAKVADLPISSWTYIHDADRGIRHIGPMAQDFYAAFGTGHTDKGISTLDSSGVALAAIKALSAENDDLTLHSQRQQQVIDELMLQVASR